MYANANANKTSSLATDMRESLANSEYDPFSKEISNKRERSITERTFSKITPESLRGGVITLVTAAIGLGLLTYPKAYSFYGYILGSAAIAYSALSTMISYTLLSSLCGLYPNHKLYSELVGHFLGKFWLKYTSWIFIFYYVGCCIGYLIVINTFFKDVLGPTIASWLNTDFNDSFKKELGFFLTLALVGFLFLGTLMRRVGIIRYLGILVVIMVFYLTVVTVVQAKSYVDEVKPEYEALGTEKFFDYILNFGLFLFAFNALPAFHQVYVQVSMPTVRRIRKIGYRVSFLLLAFYSLFTIAAYISLGTLMQDKNFDIFPNKQPLSTDPHDIYMKVLKCVFMVCLLSTYIVNSIPLKTQIMAETGIKDSTTTNIILAASITIVTGFLSYIYPSITSWFGILGSVGATSMIVVLPTLCYVKGFSGKPLYKTSVFLVKIWAVLTSTLSFGCLIATILDMQGIHPDW